MGWGKGSLGFEAIIYCLRIDSGILERVKNVLRFEVLEDLRWPKELETLIILEGRRRGSKNRTLFFSSFIREFIKSGSILYKLIY